MIPIPESEITVKNIDKYIEDFNKEYGVYDDVLIRLFKNSDNDNYDNVFCRVGLLDLIYSTGIQRFNKGGIDTVTRHIIDFHEEIDAAKTAKTIDTDIYENLMQVTYKNVSAMTGAENNIPVFASKFLSFTNPEVYPIMDSIVKKVIGVRDAAGYEEYCGKLKEFIEKKITPVIKELDIEYSLKDIDKFLWMWGKENLS